MGTAPAPDAAPEVLVRRLYYNLIGLPPTPAEVENFVHATHAANGTNGTSASDGAYERLVDSLLASPHFGETWGRHWLDVARFAESSGGGRTLLFKDAGRVRDYGVRGFNSDPPFDGFIPRPNTGELLP